MQTCVVSLEPVVADITEPFVIHYAAGQPAEGDEEVLVALEEDESPEPLVGGAIDVGEAVTQQLVLALDPYPRKPGAVVPAAAAPPTQPAENGPFAALAALKKD